MKNWSMVIISILLFIGTLFPTLSLYATESGSTTRYMMNTTRQVVRAPHAMVAASQTLAVQVGLDVLKAGGNAVDAAVAVNAMLGLTEPASCGIGGDLFVIYWDNKDGKLYGLNASGRSPRDISIDKVKERSGNNEEFIPVKSPLAWSVPGCVDGWIMLLNRFGTMKLSELLQPSIMYAREGFPVAGWPGKMDPLDTRNETFRQTYYVDGKPIKDGDVFHNPDLADTYEKIAAGGRDAFYKGEIARKIVEYSKEQDGFFSVEDFENHHGEWVEPVSANYRGYQIWELPPNGQGIAALQMLKILEGYDLKSMGHNSAEYLHLYTESKKLAFADRARYYADPDFYQTPVEYLISDQYAAERRKLISPDSARKGIWPGKLPHSGNTVYFTVADKNRNMISFIQSIYWSYGSGFVPRGLGFCLQNRGASFALDPEHPNCLAPEKRPFHTIIPAFVTMDGKPLLSFGVMGGDMQPQGHTQILCNIIDFGMNLQEAGDAPRVRHFGSPQPNGSQMVDGGSLAIEIGVNPEVRRKLAELGHNLVHPFDQFFGGYQAIMLDSITGMYSGASDPRRAGAAIGY